MQSRPQLTNVKRLRCPAPKTVTGQWRVTDADAWSDAGTCEFDSQGDRRFGLFNQNGPKDQIRWVRFDRFVIAELKKGS